MSTKRKQTHGAVFDFVRKHHHTGANIRSLTCYMTRLMEYTNAYRFMPACPADQMTGFFYHFNYSDSDWSPRSVKWYAKHQPENVH